jgi:hypothetical protein
VQLIESLYGIKHDYDYDIKITLSHMWDNYIIINDIAHMFPHEHHHDNIIHVQRIEQFIMIYIENVKKKISETEI